MKYDIINEKDAPAAPANTSNAAEEAQRIIKHLKKGLVAQVEPEGTQTIRGLRLNLSKAAKIAGVKLQTWVANDYLYVKPVD
jgi:hypothetical protein